VASRLNVATSFDRVYFRPGRFLRQFLYHLLAPFSLPYILCRDGIVFAQNQMWIRHGAAYFQAVTASTFWLVVIFWAMSDENDRRFISATEPVTAILLYTIHRLMIGTKYAYVPDSIISHLHNKLDLDVMLRLELVGGWMEPSPETCKIGQEIGFQCVHDLICIRLSGLTPVPVHCFRNRICSESVQNRTEQSVLPRAVDL